MEAQYKTKTSRTITAISEFASNTAKESGVTIPVIIKNQSEVTVFTAQITFYISLKQKT